ncbi:hypothetical protein M9H77_31104 [Catharanthus roseus]|uniref:Uncharacterized protein n=1 Tax=Catharanthus roseus TaxID=4058 RepID=A0ACC0A0F2_CATRO|nr:hypothetical protein M9H77_31104 [Catharanthus roseus]
MVRPGARRGDDDLGTVIDITGLVEGRAVTVSSCGVRRRHSTSDIPSTSASIAPGLQLGAQFFEQLAGSVPVDSSYSGAEYGATAHGNPSSDVGLGRDFGTSRSEEAVRVGSLCIHSSEGSEDKREDDGGYDDDDDDDDDGDDDGDDHEPVPVVEALSSGHRPAPSKGKRLIVSFMSVMSKIAGSRQKRPEKWRPPTNPMQRKKSKNDDWEQTGPADGGPQDPVLVPSYSGHRHSEVEVRYVSLTGWTPNDPAVVQLAGEIGLSHLRSYMFQHPNSSLLSAFVESSLFTNKSGNNVPGKLWPLVKNVTYLYWNLGQASRADAKELSGGWSLLEGLFLSNDRAWIYLYFPMFTPPVRSGARLCKPHIQRFAMLGHKMENKLIDLRIHLDTMTADKAPSHLLNSTWTSIPTIYPSRCTDDYIPWFLPRTHPRNQNLDRLPRGIQLPIIAPITPHVLLDMVARELDHDDIDDATKVSRASDMIKSV